VYDELIEPHSMHSKMSESDFIKALLCSCEERSLELVGVVTHTVPSMFGCKNDVVSLPSKHMQELGLRKKVIH
jgi:hypothetical protein